MSYAEDIIKLRQRVSQAMDSGAIDGSKETFETVLIQIMNDAEKNRQNCVAQAENFRKQAATVDGQAAAFSSVVSIVYNVINGYIRIAERAKEEEARVAEEKAENQPETSVKKPSKQNKKKAS